MKKFGKVLVLVVAFAMLVSGCGKQTGTIGDLKLTDNLGTTYPLETDDVLTIWGAMPGASDDEREFHERELAKKIEEETGVKVEFTYPSGAGYDESFNLMLASGELPDIILFNWMRFPGGAEKAINDGYIIPLGNVVEKYCPNLMATLKELNAEKFYKTDSGEMFMFPLVYNGDPTITGGLMLRQDWLTELNLEVPETIEEWETVLRAFKEKKGTKAPLSVINQAFEYGCFAGAFGTKLDFFVEDGIVKNGYAEDGYKDFLTLMNKWYNEGLLDPNYVTIDNSTVISNMLSDISGATFGGQGGMMGALMAAKPYDEFDLVAAPFPVLNKGDKAYIVQRDAQSFDSTGAAITTACDNIELAAKFLDYGYSKQGALTMGFGIEGVSYEMVDGNPVYTDLITKNPEGKSMRAMLDTYTLSASATYPFIQDYRYLEQYAQLPQQKQALKVWSDFGDEEAHTLPPLTLLEEEQKVISQKLNAVKTYQSEMLGKFIIGTEPLENFDKYIENLNKTGNNEVLKAYQSAYERFLKR